MIAVKEAFENEEKTPSLPARTEEIFRPDGWLCTVLGLEHRPQQEQMAIGTAQAFATNTPLLFEAGTGVGKSLAYLIPAIMQAVEADRQCIVSTHTISLQEQIQKKDLVLCRELFRKAPQLAKFKDFKTALLVGRGNYLCGTRLARAIAGGAELFPISGEEDLERVCHWAGETKTGLLHELNPSLSPEVWDWVNADSAACNPRNCSPQTCFFQKARARVRQAQIIILNHSLLFSLLNAGGRAGANSPGILFADDFAVLDEAQTLPGVASEQFGWHISEVAVDRLLKKLFNPRRKKGLLQIFGRRDDCATVEKTIALAKTFFDQLQRNHLGDKKVIRIREPSLKPNSLNPNLKDLARRTAIAADKLEEGSQRDDLLDLRDRLNSCHRALEVCLMAEEDDHVYWMEDRGKRRRNVSLRAAPINVEEVLRKHLFARRTSALLTSATLAEGTDMGSFMDKVGATGQPAERVTSSFDYEENMRIYIVADAPPPSRENARLDIDYLADMIEYCALRVRGGTLVLFTSHADMRRVAGKVEESLANHKRPFFLHGRDGSRAELARCFHEAGNGVLFGTDSFWAGVDIPGPSLSQVILTRLPFENPTHPVVEAKCEWVQSLGGNPFRDITLPEAVIKFRQGIGRLIRKKSDKGTVTLLDSRLLKKEYGRRFLAVLPRTNYITLRRSDRNSVFRPLEAD